MNQTLQTIFNHVSVRKFTEQKLTDNQIKQLVQAAQAASTASYQQSYSIIGIDDDAIKAQIAKMAGDQDFINGGHLFIFNADLNRNHLIAQKLDKNINETVAGVDAVIIGAVDASIAAQNMTLAAESMGMGICYIGGVRDGIVGISELLHLPDEVYPVFGLLVGYPTQKNDPKPRIPFNGIYHKNHYDPGKLSIIEQYNQETRQYYQNRSGKKSDRTWADTAIRSLETHPRDFMKQYLNNRGLAKH